MSKQISTITGVIIIFAVAIIGFCGVFAYQYYSGVPNIQSPISNQNSNVQNPNIATEKISQQDAISLVRNFPKVKSWLALFNQSNGTSLSGGRPVVEIDHQDTATYYVHVYEIVNDHTATQNWYDVDMKTGSITPEF